jgi:hypothetical protein
MIRRQHNAMTRTHQVAVLLPTPAFEALKRQSAALKTPYANVIALALAALERDAATASQQTSRPLVVYQCMAAPDRLRIKGVIRNWRSSGGSFAAIAKRLYREHGVCGTDNLPLLASTIRGMCAQ